MSANPRVVLSDTWVGPQVSPFQPGAFFARRGTVVDITPGSALETAYGGPSNLGAIPVTQGDPATSDHATLGN